MLTRFAVLTIAAAAASHLDDTRKHAHSSCGPVEDSTSLLQVQAVLKPPPPGEPTWNCAPLPDLEKEVEKIFERPDIKTKFVMAVDPGLAAKHFVTAYLKGDASSPTVLESSPRCRTGRHADMDAKRQAMATTAHVSYGVSPLSVATIQKFMSIDLKQFVGPPAEVLPKAAKLHVDGLRLISLEDLPFYEVIDRGLDIDGTIAGVCATRRQVNQLVVQPAAMQTCSPFVPSTGNSKTLQEVVTNPKLDFIFLSHLWNGREESALRTLKRIKAEGGFGTHVYICLYSNNQCFMNLGAMRQAELSQMPDQGAFQAPTKARPSPDWYWNKAILSHAFGDLSSKAKTFVWLGERLDAGFFKWNFDELTDFIKGHRTRTTNWVENFVFGYYSEEEDPCNSAGGPQNSGIKQEARGPEKRRGGVLGGQVGDSRKTAGHSVPMTQEFRKQQVEEMMAKDDINLHYREEAVTKFKEWSKLEGLQCSMLVSSEARPAAWAECVQPWVAYVKPEAQEDACRNGCRLLALLPEA